jgi:hypothetical protein
MQPYISDAERERARWMTLAEAIAHVEEHGNCERPALKQLCDALGDRKLHIKWEDQKPIHASPDGIVFANWPPDDADFWQHACIRDGKLFDPFTQRERTLLLLRFDVQRIWPEQPPAPERPPAPPSPPPERSRPKVGRPSNLDKIKEMLSGCEWTNSTDAVRHVRETWSANDGPCPNIRTIQRLVKEILGDKTRQN